MTPGAIGPFHALGPFNTLDALGPLDAFDTLGALGALHALGAVLAPVDPAIFAPHVLRLGFAPVGLAVGAAVFLAHVLGRGDARGGQGGEETKGTDLHVGLTPRDGLQTVMQC
jgi:hypothetical protein